MRFLSWQVLVSCLVSHAAQAADWPRFRGPDGSGVSSARGLPAEFGPGRNVAWKAKVSEGLSSPVISAGRVYITAQEGDDRIVLSLDEQTGKERWRRTVQKSRTEIFNRMSGPATPTPAADGERVVAFFPDVGLIAFDREGAQLWRSDPGPFKSMHGIASSPVIAEGWIVLQIDQLEGSFVAAFEGRSGKRVWKAERPDGVTGGYSTPSIHRNGKGAIQVIVAGPYELTGHDLLTGKKLWWATGVTNAPVALPVIHEDLVLVSEPVGEPINDPDSLKEFFELDRNKDGKVSANEVADDPSLVRLLERIDRGFGNGDGHLEAAEVERAFGSFAGKGGLAAVQLDGTGDVTPTAVRWRYTKSVPHVPSVLVHGGALFVIRDGGILTSFDPRTGEVIHQGRLPDAMGKYYASPVAADGKAYFTSEDGRVTVIEAKPMWKVLATNDLAAPCQATPAIGEGRIYFRAGETLYAFGASP